MPVLANAAAVLAWHVQPLQLCPDWDMDVASFKPGAGRPARRKAGLADMGVPIDPETRCTESGTMARNIGSVTYILQARRPPAVKHVLLCATAAQEQPRGR